VLEVAGEAVNQPVLVLSLFPGIGLLDRAFEEEGFCVVRGPDLLWGGDIKTFHPPAGKFEGVIGGDPCPAHSHLGAVSEAAGCDVEADLSAGIRARRARSGAGLVSARERTERSAGWFLPLDWWAPPTPSACIPTVTANATIWKDGRAFGDKSARYYRSTMLPAQGLPADFLEDAPFTIAGKIRVVGNGVPLPMGRAIAKAVKRAMGYELEKASA